MTRLSPLSQRRVYTTPPWRKRCVYETGVKAECVVTDEGNGVLELKNIAVDPAFWGRGYGRALIDFIVSTYSGRYSVLQVGTGDLSLIHI